ncbi:hypothetical protein ACT1U9_18290 [Streptomyces sp. BR1]|uniref:hypothetical protein n=1 Tax=Streptomyces sp. BR1 TaxID=1592323 RepID=UPI00402B0C14
MNTQSFWSALADAPVLSPVQQSVVAEAVARLRAPDTGARFFSRPDLSDAVRHQLIRDTFDRQVLKAMLATPVVTTEHLLAAAEKLGAETVLLDMARSRWDLPDAQLRLVSLLDHAAARRVAETWQHFGPEIREALILAAAREPEELRALTEEGHPLSDADQEKLRAVAKKWHDDVWALLSAEPAARQWPALIADEQSGELITGLLLRRAENIDDPTLLACLRAAFPEDAADDEEDTIWTVFLPLSRLSDVVSRHPRALVLYSSVIGKIASSAAAALFTEAREKGVRGTGWKSLERLADLCTAPGVLQDAADCLAEASAPQWSSRGRHDPEWIAARSAAADALVRNPLCPSAALVALAPFLGAETAARFVGHPDEGVREAVARILEKATEQSMRSVPTTASSPRKRPVHLAVPSDDALAESADPQAALAAFLPLRGTAAQRRETALAILDSRHTTAVHLREIPAVLALSSTAQAAAVAALVQAELGDDATAWEAFQSALHRMVPNATKTVGALIAEAVGSAGLD